jgi:hypothetical protein
MYNSNLRYGILFLYHTSLKIMKKYKLLFCAIFFIHFQALSQLRQSYLFPDIDNHGQLGNETCWAATIHMLSNIYSKDSTVQCKLIELDPSINGVCCNTECSLSENVRGVAFSLLLNKLKLKFSNFTSSLDITPAGFDSLNKSYPKIGNYSISKNENLPFQTITESFDLNNSPLILNKFFDSIHSHIVSIVGYEHTIDTLSNRQLKWMFVQDSWPRRNGSRYLMSYEYYKRRVFFKDEKYNYEPNKALIYNFATNNNSPISLKENSILLKKNDAINIVTDIMIDKYQTATIQANKILNHINKNASDGFLNFSGIKRNESNVDQKSILNIINLNDILQKYASVTYLEHNEIFTASNWFDGYITLFSDINQVLITIADSKNKKTKLAVIAIDTTKNEEWYVSRVEPFRTSIVSVVEDLNIDKKEIKSIIVNKAMGEYPDFFIVNYKSNKKPVYVDLSGQNELGLSINAQGNTGVFKYQVSKIDGKNKAKISAYLAPSFPKTTNQNKFVVSNAGKAFIKSYQDLIKSASTNSCQLINPIHCKPFVVEKDDFTEIDSTLKLSFTSYFHTDPKHITYGTFSTPLITNVMFQTIDSNGVGNGQFMKMAVSRFSANCSECYPNPNFLPKTKYWDDNWQDIIFVPIVKYKTLPNKKFDESDYLRLKGYAVKPIDIKEIKDPFIESNDGYLANINVKDIKNFNDKKSITGIVCDVVLKDNSVIQCYLFNRQSFTTSSPYMKWKK